MNHINLDRVEKYAPEMLSVVRIVVALLFLEHGTAKLLGFPPSPHGEPAFMTLMWIQGLIELAGGALLALGLFTRPVAFILSGNMAVAYFMGHASKGFFPLINGGDAAILYCFIFLLFFVAGAGRWSLDAELMHDYRGEYRGKQRVDAAVATVAHPSFESARPRLLLDPVSIADALHPTPDRHLMDRVAHLFLEPEKFAAARLYIHIAREAAHELR